MTSVFWNGQTHDFFGGFRLRSQPGAVEVAMNVASRGLVRLVRLVWLGPWPPNEFKMTGNDWNIRCFFHWKKITLVSIDVERVGLPMTPLFTKLWKCSGMFWLHILPSKLIESMILLHSWLALAAPLCSTGHWGTTIHILCATLCNHNPPILASGCPVATPSTSTCGSSTGNPPELLVLVAMARWQGAAEKKAFRPKGKASVDFRNHFHPWIWNKYEFM